MPNQIDVVLDEAFVNFDNQRYRDAAASFKYLINSSVNSKNYEDVLYFSYRLLKSLEQVEGSKREQVETWKNLGLFCLKVALLNVDELCATSWSIESLEMKELVLRHLGLAEIHVEVIENLAARYIEALSGDDVDSVLKKISRNPHIREYLRRERGEEYRAALNPLKGKYGKRYATLFHDI